jgi:hypothetical protein
MFDDSRMSVVLNATSSRIAAIRRSLTGLGWLSGLAAAGKRLGSGGLWIRFDKKRVQRNRERSSQSIQKVDRGVPTFTLKFAHPRPIHAGIRREPLLGDSPLGSQQT